MKSPQDHPEKPVIYGFYDFREYLKALFNYHKALSPVFSHRYIVRRAGFKSPNVLKNVMDGKRNITLNAARKFAEAFKIEEREQRYFLTLVLFGQARTLGDREKHLSELMELKIADAPSELEEKQGDIFKNWWHPAIREMTGLPDFRNSSKWIAQVLAPSVTPAQAADSLQMLKELGLIKRGKGKWIPAEQTLKTDPKVHSVKLAHFHREMIKLGAESLSRFPGKDREVSGTTIRVSKTDVEAIKNLLRRFRLKILEIASNSMDADQIYQLNFQYFPLVRRNRPERLK